MDTRLTELGPSHGGSSTREAHGTDNVDRGANNNNGGPPRDQGGAQQPTTTRTDDGNQDGQDGEDELSLEFVEGSAVQDENRETPV